MPPSAPATCGLQRLADFADLDDNHDHDHHAHSDDDHHAASTTTCARIPEETAGPYPADGSNGPTVLTSSGVVRRDIRSSFAGSAAPPRACRSHRADDRVGIDVRAARRRAVYLWHCDREGRYSLYTQGVTNQNYLRGVQEADANGRVTFTSIYPACYAGRWPHIHFEVYPSLPPATSHEQQDRDVADRAAESRQRSGLRDAGYEQSIRNAAQVTLASDIVFSDGSSLELATITGTIAGGLTSTLTVAVNG